MTTENTVKKRPIPNTGAGLPSWPKQSSMLAERYLDAMLGDSGTLLLLLAQAPIIAAMCVLIWGEVEQDTKSLYFVLSLSAVWFGCINAAREIVKERPLFERERLFGLSPLAYVLSKLRVLLLLDILQVLLLLGVVEWRVGLRGALGWQFASLLACALAGTGLGLLISALTRKSDRAVAAVPIVILPQILFSEFAIPRDQFGHLTTWIERFMIVKWGYRIFTEAAATEPSYGWILLSLLILLLMTVLYTALAVLGLHLGDSENFL